MAVTATEFTNFETADRLQAVSAPSGVRQPGRGAGPELPSRIEALLGFPEISLAEFKELPRYGREQLLLRNRILSTDTYNRTMSHLAATRPPRVDPLSGQPVPLDTAPGTFTLQLRKAPFDYMVVAGIREAIDGFSTLRITESEFRFAKEYYAATKVPFFNERMWRTVLDEHGGRLPIDIDGVPDGTVLLAGEPVLTVRGPVELAAHIEAEFHRIFFATAVATRAHEILRIVGDPSRYLEVGKRGAPREDVHLTALSAMYVGAGFNRTSNDCGMGLREMLDIGTMGHRYVQSFRTVEAAFRHAIEQLPVTALLPDLIETYQGIELSLRLKEEYRHTGKPIWVRLDSGDILEQTRYYLRRTTELGFTDPMLDKLVVEGIESIDEIAAIERMIVEEFGEQARARVVYAAGGLLSAVETSRADYSSGYKLSEFTDTEGELEPTMKFSNSPGKRSYPGAPELVVQNGIRVVAHAGETLAGTVQKLYQPLVRGGWRVLPDELPSDLHEKRERQFGALFGERDPRSADTGALRAVPSPVMMQKIGEVVERYGQPE